MAAPAELSAVLARTSAVRLLAEHARMWECDVGVFSTEGEPLVASGALSGRRTSGTNGHVVVDGLAEAAAVPLLVYDRLVGYVAAAAPQGGASAAERVAREAASVLEELCSREYELNDLSREILGAYEELNLFYDLAAELAGAREPEATCEIVLARTCRVVACERAWILLADASRRVLRVAAERNLPRVSGFIPWDDGRAGRALASGQTELVDDVGQFGGVGLKGFECAAQRTLITVPLCIPGQEDRPALGVMQLCDKQGGAAFTSGDLKLAQALATQAAALIQNSRLIGYERELRIARTIQQSLLPAAPPRIAGLDVAGACRAASTVGGDYYDHLYVGESGLGLLVADVSGHNLAAALMQTAARSTFRAAIHSDPRPVEVLSRANQVLYEDLTRSELFLTAWFGHVDAATGRFVYGDAGHNPSLLYRARTGEVEELATGGLPIGVQEDGLYCEREITLEPGDVVVAYTDGLTEARRAGGLQEYGETRLAEALRSSAGLNAAGIVGALFRDVAEFDGGGPAGDDRSVLVVKMRAADSR